VSVWSHNPEPGPETRQTIFNSGAAAFILMPYVTICELEAHMRCLKQVMAASQSRRRPDQTCLLRLPLAALRREHSRLPRNHAFHRTRRPDRP